MKKIINKEFMVKMMMFFLMIQPLLDIAYLYNYQLVGLTIPTIIRLFLFGLMTIIFMIDQKKLKLIIFYGTLCLIYAIFHHFHINAYSIIHPDDYSVLGEIIYLIRLGIPIIFIIINFNYKLKFEQITKVFYVIAFIFASIMIITNILMIAYPSYTYVEKIYTNIWGWFTNNPKRINGSELASKGIFGYANHLAGLFILILPVLLYSNYQKFSFKKLSVIFAFVLSMLILGTRISCYLSIVILIIMLCLYIFVTKIVKNLKFDKITFVFNILLIGLAFSFFLVSPIQFKSDRVMSQEAVKYNEKNNLEQKNADYLELYKKGVVSKEKEEEIKKFIKENYRYFSVNKDQVIVVYPYEQNPHFWLEYFQVSYQNKNDNRDFQLYLFKYLYNESNNKYDKYLGLGYSNTFPKEIILEHDIIFHYFVIGIIGIFLFILPYFVVLLIAGYKVLTDFKNKATLKNMTYMLIISMVLVASLLSGNLLDTFLVNIFLAFISGQLLNNILRKDCEMKEVIKKKRKKNDINISVIVPVYKTEQYLERCLDSLVNQTLKKIEIIVVNDGSPDNSQSIIDRYVEKYPIIKSYVKENGGLSVARNYGLKKARGEYIAFVDSDDWVQLDMFEKMYNKAFERDFDVVVCDFEYAYADSNINKKGHSLYERDLFNKDEIKVSMLDFYPVVWNKLYKKTLLTKSKVEFKRKVLFEDVEFLYRLYPFINSIGVVKEPLLLYFQRDGSITHVFDERLLHYIENWNGIIEYYKSHNLYDEYKKELEYCYVRYLYATLIKQACHLEKDDYDKVVDMVIKSVEAQFKNYYLNSYFYTSLKGLYLLLFNKLTSKIIYRIYHK